MRAENLSITLQTEESPARLAPKIEAQREVSSLRPRVSEKAIEGLKFSVCLPPASARQLLALRAHDEPAVRNVLKAPLRVID